MSEQAKAALWAAIEKHAGKEGRRDQLEAGHAYAVNKVAITAEIDGQPVDARFAGKLIVNHDTVRASSTAADPKHLVAVLLAKIPKRCREQLLAELPEKFAQLGGLLPAVKPEILAAAEQFLGQLRVRREQPVRGSVSFLAASAQAPAEPREARRAAA